MPVLLAWLTNAGNVASVGTAGYEGYKAYKTRNVEGMALVTIGVGVIVLLSLFETGRQKRKGGGQHGQWNHQTSVAGQSPSAAPAP